MCLEVHNVGGWLTHGDLALTAGVDFLAVAEHRLIPARVRSEWFRLKGKGLPSIWAPASQVSSHVGNAGVGVVSLRGAPLALPTFATAQFKSFFDCGRAVRCMLPLASGSFLHLFVLYGFQGADADAEQLALTEQLFDAVSGELSVVARGQPCLLVGDFNVEPTKIPCLAKGISAGLWVDFGEAWALAAGLQPTPTCKRSWTAAGGHRRDFILEGPLAAAALLFCKAEPDRWIAPHLAVRALFDCGRWESWVTQPVHCTPLWPASWLPAIDKSRGSKSVEVQRVWEIYDERLQLMSRQDASLLDESLGLDDVSMAWVVWSRAAESALADAFRFSGGPLPSVGLVLGRGSAVLRRVQLGGPRIRRARADVADVHDAADVFLYCDSSVAPLLDMRRRFKAVMDVLGAMIRHGVSPSRSVELTAQWDRVLALGADVSCYSWMVFLLIVLWILVHSFMLLLMFIAVLVISSIRLWFIAVMRRFGDGEIGFGRTPRFILIVGFILTWCRLHPFFSVSLVLLRVALVFFLILQGLMKNSERLGFPIFAVLGKGRPALTNSALRLRVGCRFYLKFIFPG